MHQQKCAIRTRPPPPLSPLAKDAQSKASCKGNDQRLSKDCKDTQMQLLNTDSIAAYVGNHAWPSSRNIQQVFCAGAFEKSCAEIAQNNREQQQQQNGG